MFSEGDCNNTMEQLPWLIVSCPPGGEDLLWGFREHLKKSQVECSSSSRVLDETLSLLSPVVCAGLLQRSWKALGKTAWFSARAQLQNLGAFCSSCASGAPLGHWSKSATVQISSHDHGHGFIWFQDGGVGWGGWGVLKRVQEKALGFLPLCPSHQQCSLQYYERRVRPSAQQLLPPPTLAGPATHQTFMLSSANEATRTATVPFRSRWWMSGNDWMLRAFDPPSSAVVTLR